jgi:hypothetical protein
MLAAVLAWALWPSGNLPPLEGFIDVQVHEEANPRRHDLWLGEAGALPLRQGDELRIVAELNRPAYLYVLWIEAGGKVVPVYPWQNGHWEERPAEEERMQKLHRPEETDRGYRIEKGPGGMDTLVLLAREKPLPPDVDLRTDLEKLPLQDEKDLRAVAWFENGQVRKGGNPLRASPRFDVTWKAHPLLQVQERIRQLQHKRGFAYSCAVSFATLGQ